MQALTLHAPWAWAVMHGGKDIENRSWAPPNHMLGQRIAIHAGMASLAEEREDLVRICSNVPDEFMRGAILGTVQVVGYVDEQDVGLMWNGERIEKLRSHEPAESVWFGGPVGWLLRDPKPLERPIPQRGALGLWQVKEPVLSELLKATQAA